MAEPAVTRALRPPLRRLGPVRPARAASDADRKSSFLGAALTLAAFCLVGAHLGFSREGFDPIARVLFSIPGLLVIAEFYRYYRNEERKELPFNVLALIQFYVTFVFPSFVEMDFFDLSGPVTFTDSTRFLGSIAVAGGGLTLYAGMRLGELLGWRLRPRVLGVCPPFELPSGFQTASWAYLGACVLFVLVIISARSMIPGPLSPILEVSIAFDLAIGLAFARPAMLRGYWTERLGTIAFLIGGAMGLLRGMLDPVIRLGMVLVAGRWAATRKLQLPLIAALGAIYLLLQPVKQDFRAHVWTTEEQVSYSDRLNIWVSAFGRFWNADTSQEKPTSSAMDRLSELDPVMQAIQVVPVNVQYLEGRYWMTIFTAPIPRFIWADKPTTQDTEQRYAMTFNRQTQSGARGTAILLPLLVDGYWNFGWLGIGTVCLFMGLWVGICQRLWAGEHWALRAMAVAHLARLVVQGGLVGIYAGLFQHVSGLIAACWMVYGVAQLTSSNKIARSAGLPLGARRPPPRRAGAR